MNIDTGLAVVILAVLIFYLRLIGLQREQARRLRRLASGGDSPPSSRSGKQARKAGTSQPPPNYSIVSKQPFDLAIAAAGLLAVLAGVLANSGVLALPLLQTYWWVFTALGILAFSLAFKLPKA